MKIKIKYILLTVLILWQSLPTVTAQINSSSPSSIDSVPFFPPCSVTISSTIHSHVNPNPVENDAELVIDRLTGNENATIVIYFYNISGLLVKEIYGRPINNLPIKINNEEFGAGMFFYNIISGTKEINKGKFLVK